MTIFKIDFLLVDDQISKVATISNVELLLFKYLQNGYRDNVFDD